MVRRPSAAGARLRLAAALLALCAPLAHAHVFLAAPPTRAECMFEARPGDESDAAFRGAPCGRAPRGVRGVLVAGAPACLRARMVVAHASAVRVARAPGTAAAGGVPSYDSDAAPTPFDRPEALLATFDCAALPGGCAHSEASNRGDYTLPVVIPANATPGVYTLQLRQAAPDIAARWSYYDCADVLVVARLADAPPALAGAAAALAVSCAASFQPVAYPNVIYIQSAVMFGVAGLGAFAILAADAAWLLRRHRQARTASAASQAALQEEGKAAQQPPAPYTLTLVAAARQAARQHWRWLAAQAAVVVTVFAAVLALNMTWRTCKAPGGGFVPH